MDKILNMLSGYLTAAQQTLQHYGPTVWNATVQLIRFKGIWNLAVGAVFLVLAIAAIVYLVRTIILWTKDVESWAWTGPEAGYSRDEPTVLGVLAVILLGILTIAFSITAGNILLDFSNWLDAFAPQLAVLYALATKAGIL